MDQGYYDKYARCRTIDRFLTEVRRRVKTTSTLQITLNIDRGGVGGKVFEEICKEKDQALREKE